MKKQDNKIKCPKCGTEIDVNAILYHQLEEDLQKQFSLQLDEEKKKLEKQLKEKIQQAQNEQIKTLEEELNEKSNQLKDYNKVKADISRLAREKNELKANLEAEAEKKLEDLKNQLDTQLAVEKKKFSEQFEQLEKEKGRLENEKQTIEKQIQDGVQKTLKSEKQKLEKQLTEKIKEEQNEQVKALEKELTEKSTQLKEFNKAKADIARLQREKDELKESVEAEAEKKLNETLKTEKEKIKKAEEERMSLKVSEKEQIIDQLKRQLQEAQRKADQSSTQLQGEVQELAIEEWLAANFPLDAIAEIKKGARGGDCVQVVNTRSRQNCGSIYYESKRTKDFQPSWIEKFKTDMRNKGADIGVIVTDAMPKDMERMGHKDGVWICSFDEFKGLCFVLRESVVQISNAIATQENKGDKMTLLYDYLTSNEFKLQIEAIVEGFSQMNIDLESEKRAMQGIWKKREKQIQKVLLNTSFMYSSIKGIAGNAVQPIKMLELPEGEAPE
jgi:hypothetical protein